MVKEVTDYARTMGKNEGNNMDIKDIELLLNNTLQTPEDTASRDKFTEAVIECLEGKKCSDDLISIVIRGMEIDQGAGFYRYLKSASKANLQKIWKQLNHYQKKVDKLDDNYIKLIAGMLPLALMKIGNMESLCENIMMKLISICTTDAASMTDTGVADNILDNIESVIRSRARLPKWGTIEVASETKLNFCQWLLDFIKNENEEKYKEVKDWVTLGTQYAKKQIKTEKIEEKIPASRIEELRDIAYHYQLVEEQNRKNLYAIAELEETVSALNRQVGSLEEDKQRLNLEILEAQKAVDNKNDALEKAEKEINDLEQTINAFKSLKENDIKTLYDDVANELKSIYQDFAETEADEMDPVLGEIYREKLKDIFRILARKGIKLEQ